MSNDCTPSTRAIWRCETIELPPEGIGTARRSRPTQPFLPRREWRSPLNLVVEYRGAAEPLIQVRSRGRTYMFSGHDCFLDVMMRIWEGNGGGAAGGS